MGYIMVVLQLRRSDGVCLPVFIPQFVLQEIVYKSFTYASVHVYMSLTMA